MSTTETVAAARLRLKITLESFRPAIWRRVEVNDDLTFWEFHRVIQLAMGWDDDHLHEFLVGGQRVRIADPDGDMFGDQAIPEDSTTLGELLEGQRKFRYWYDFGDDWWHTIAVEKRLPPDPDAPPALLVAGKGACPPEDCGGVYGYANLLDILNHPDHEEHEETRDWLGDDFDPGVFDFAVHAARVALIGRRPKRAKPTKAK